MKSISKLLIVGLLLAALAGCGTINGFGHDVSATGHGISNAARSV